MEKAFIVVGLGNPGEKYANTLHNAGHMVVDELAKKNNVTFKQHKTPNLVAEYKLGVGLDSPKIILAKTCSYMNESGGPVKALMKFYNITAKNIIVIHDELDIAKFSLKMKANGGEGGHNGLKSISQSIGTKNYMRIRYGIGRPPGRTAVVDYVLSNFHKKEEEFRKIAIIEAADAVEDIVTLGFDKAQLLLHTNQHNK